MPKKSPTTTDNTVSKTLLDTQRLLEMLEASPALNGGFTVLMNKIDALQVSQDATAAKVESIHEAIYNPDEGIYARIKNAATVEQVEKVENVVDAIAVWKTSEEKASASMVESATMVKDHDTKLANLLELKQDVIDIGKKVGLAVAGALFTLLCRLIYVALSGHVHFI